KQAAEKAADDAERAVAMERAETRRAQAEADAARAADQRRTDEAAAKQAAAMRRTEEAAAAQAASTRKSEEADAARATERRRTEEAAAAQAAAARKTEEAAAARAATARKTDETAAARARAARQAEEQAMQAAATARTAAESRKQAAEKAADDAERAVAMERDAAKVARDRKRAADEAEAEARDAARRKASADEIAAARAEASRLAAERAKAERELADRTKEVARTRDEASRLAAAKKSSAAEAERLAAERAAATAEVARLKQAAADARDARAREEARLAEVTKARAAEEKSLAQLRAKPVAAPAPAHVPASAPPSAPAPVPVPVKPVVAAKPAPVTPAPAKPTARIAAVRFAPQDNEHTVVVDIDGKGATAELVRTGVRKAELIVHGATLPSDLARTLDTSRFGGPIRAVSSYTDPKSGDVKVVVELTSDVTPRFDTSGGDLRLAFAASPKVRTQSVPGPVVGGFGATSTPVTQTSVAQLGKKKVYRGPTIDLDFKDADIHDLLRTLGDVGRVSIVVPEEVRAQVTVRLKRVPWDQALDVILASKGLGYRREGNIYRIAPQKQLDAEDEAEAARLRAMVDMEAPRPEVYRLNYTDAESVKPTLAPLLSPKGKIEVDKRTNAIVVNDVSRNRREIIDLATLLDTQTPQISIEARIVEARSQYERQIGIQWGGRSLVGAAGGNATGLIFPSTIGLTGGAGDQNKSEAGVAAPADFAVNLPANGSNGAIGMTLGSVGGNVNINLRLSALEETGTVRIISAPKVTVLNNIEAEMKQGVKIPISIVSAEGTQTQFVRAELSLKVTPYVSQRDCAIMMDVQVTKDEPDFVNTGARGDPTILNKEAKTRMLVNDGETSVMGGIYTRNSGLSYSKIPFFGDLPVLGWLFKNRRETDDRAELLIFITPKITNKASLRCAQ
ncbi:MAG TPA: type IV pilus secretin PilQ, partial [Kofleriaceae bacterium]|nr:type IV pilus secretin PilQ [Kofleriaceae bacterium]